MNWRFKTSKKEVGQVIFGKLRFLFWLEITMVNHKEYE